MKPADFVKALLVAVLVMALDFGCDFGFVSAWAMINHHPLTMTDPKTIELSSLATRIFAPVLFVLFIWLFSRRRPDRNAFAFAAAAFGIYFLVDWALVAFQNIFTVAVIVTLGLKLGGAFVGALLSRLGRRA